VKRVLEDEEIEKFSGSPGKMQLVDVDVLINAFRPDAPQHEAYHSWVEQLVTGQERYAMSELVLSALCGF
jgi:predicted nucleic acid-binding protein